MRRGLSFALVLALAAAACSGNGGDGGQAKEPSSRTKETRPATSGSGRPRSGGVLRVGVERPRSLDPAQARSAAEVLVADQLFDTLTAYAAGGKDVAPSLAASWGSSPDQKDWDFKLRPGATFHNGRPLTAADVKYSLERLARKGSGAAELVVAQLETVTGYRPFSIDGTAPELAGVTVPVPDVVRIRLDQPLATLPAVLAHPAFGVVPREAVDTPAPAFASEPVGSGPFRFESRTADTVRLARAPGSQALLDAVELRLTDDPRASFRAFKSGQLEWSQVSSEDVEEAIERFGRDGFAPYLAVLFYGFNLRNAKFADVRFREAIVHAIDRRAIASAVYGDSVAPVDGPVVRGVPGYQASPCGSKCEHDQARARALAQEAFPAGPPEIQIDFDDDETQAAIARAIQANLGEVGIKANLRPHSFEEYARLVDRGEQELFRLGWIGVYPAADNFLTPLFLTGSETNVTGFSVPVIDDVLRAARAEPDPPRRLGLYQDAERRIMDMVPIVPLAQFQTRAVVSGRVRDLEMTTVGTFDASRVWLAATRD